MRFVTVFFFACLCILQISTQKTCGDPNRPSNCTLAQSTIDCVKHGGAPPNCVGTVPTYEPNNCCPTCYPVPCPPAVCTKYADLPICNKTLPTLVDGCLSCQVDVTTCDFSKLPPCKSLGDLALDENTKCPVCQPASCNYDRLPPCADGEDPVFDGTCLSCIKLTKCLQNCATPIPSIRSCNLLEYPTYDPSSCCISCVVRLNSTCPPLQSSITTYQNLPTCSGNQSETKDYSNCCIKGCKCPINIQPQLCTENQVLDSIRNSPPCGRDDVSCFSPNSCSPSCKPGFWASRSEIIADCLASRRTCAAYEEPVDVDGEPCQSCVRPLNFSLCNSVCTNDELCVFEWDFKNDMPLIPFSTKCITKKTIIITIEDGVGNATKASFQLLKNLTKTGVYFFLITHFQRIGTIPQYRPKCREFWANIRHIRVNSITVNIDINLSIDIPDSFYQEEPEDPYSPTNITKRAIMQDTSSSFVQSSAGDPAASDYTISATTSNSTTPQSSSPSPDNIISTSPSPIPNNIISPSPSTKSPSGANNVVASFFAIVFFAVAQLLF